MERPVGEQFQLLFIVFLAGVALGAVYDLFRVLRQREAAVLAPLWDTLYCLIFTLALFLLGMGPSRGDLRLGTPLLLGLGALVWFSLFGSPARQLFRFLLGLLHRGLFFLAFPLRQAGKALGMLEKILKRVFSFLLKRYKIQWRFQSRRKASKGRSGEGEPGGEPSFQITYADRRAGGDRVRGLPAQRQPRQRRRRPGGPERKAGGG